MEAHVSLSRRIDLLKSNNELDPKRANANTPILSMAASEGRSAK
jgi:hypothetical protein